MITDPKGEKKWEDRLAPKGVKKVVLVDIDETICFYSGKRRYDLAEPSKENIAKINKLYDEDWQWFTGLPEAAPKNLKKKAHVITTLLGNN